MSSKTLPVNRLLVGVLALACIVIGVTVGLLREWGTAAAAFLRTGLLLGAIWLALPSRKREAAWANISPWTLVGVLLLALVSVRWPPLFFGLLGMIITASMFLKPRKRKEAGKR